MAPTSASVDDTGRRRKVAARMHKVAPASAARTKVDCCMVRRSLCGVKTEKSLAEIRIAVTLPTPVKKPPQSKALRLGGEAEGSGIINDATLFPASLAPLAKARANRAASPNSSIDTITGFSL